MKKLYAILLSAAMILALTACGTKTTTTTTTKQNTPASTTSAAEAWPGKNPITLIVPAGAGGSMDTAARLVMKELEKELGTTIVVENVPGGGMWIGWKQAIASKPDGYTFSIYNSPTVAIANYNENNPQEEGPKNFAKLCNMSADYGALAIAANDSRFSDMASFIAYAKENEVICTAGSVGLANGDASSAEWFNINYGTKIKVMTVDSSSDGLARFYAGDTDCFFGSVGDLANDMDAGKYKVIATFSSERSVFMPDVPCLKEMGYDYTNFSARGFAFPAGVDSAIVEKMAAALVKAIKAAEPELTKLGIETKIVSGADYEKFENDLLVSRLAIYGKTTADKVAGK